jgi:CheY-like chemotaxis protein
MKVLMVDADPNGRAALAEVMTRRGGQFLEVSNSEKALRNAQAEKPAIAIVDVLTPHLDRGDVVAQLRRDPAVAPDAGNLLHRWLPGNRQRPSPQEKSWQEGKPGPRNRMGDSITPNLP